MNNSQKSEVNNNKSVILEKVKILLIKKGKHFKELAESVGMTQQGLRHSLKKNKTTFITIQKIADFLGVSTNYLTDESNVPINHPITSDFREDLAITINKHSKGNNSVTAEYILANYLADCLNAFDNAIKERAKLHNKRRDPIQDLYGDMKPDAF